MDQQLRRLDRASLAGDDLARARLLNARLKAGMVTEARLRLAAFLRDRASMEVTGGSAGVAAMIGRFVGHLHAAHPLLPGAVAYWAARFVSPLVLETHPNDEFGENVRTALNAARDYLDHPERGAAELPEFAALCGQTAEALHAQAIDLRTTQRMLSPGTLHLGSDPAFAAALATDCAGAALLAVARDDGGYCAPAIEAACRALIARAVGHAHYTTAYGHDTAAANDFADLAEEHLFASIRAAVLPWVTDGLAVDLTGPVVRPHELRQVPDIPPPPDPRTLREEP